MNKILYQIKQRDVRGFMRKRVYNVHIVNGPPCTQTELIQQIESRIGYKVSPYVFTAIADVIFSNAAQGRETIVPDLGTFSLEIKPKAKEEPKFHRADIGPLSVKFRPNRGMVDALNDANVVFCKMPKC